MTGDWRASGLRLHPPVRLRPLPSAWVTPLHLVWALLFLFAIALVALGAMHAVRAAHEVRPAFAQLGLDYDVENSGEIRIEFEPGRAPPGKAGKLLQLVAIDGAPVASDIRITALAERLNRARGPVVTLDLKSPDGQHSRVQQRRSFDVGDEAQALRDIRLAMRLGSGLLACGALLLCSFLLARRRPDDPVALLFAFAFAGMASTIDPPLAVWMAMGWPAAYDIISSCWFYLLLIALAAFPDGIFVPRFYRWLIFAGIPLAVFVSLPDVDANIQVFTGIGALLAMLVGQVRRYRRLSPGIERQQIKWAAFGFATGLTLLLVAFVLLMQLPDNPTGRDVVLSMVITLSFSLGMAAFPLGLLIALIRLHLWEADKVISRSAAYALVTMIVGIVWAATADLAKLVVAAVVGHEHEAAATALSAMVAAGVFAPTQNIVVGWTKRRFAGPKAQLESLGEHLREWRLTLGPQELAGRALAGIDHAVHPRGALVSASIGDETMTLARSGENLGSDDIWQRLSLMDEHGHVGTLALGVRSDGNRYSREELEALRELAPVLAGALRPAIERYSRDDLVQRTIAQMQRRIDELEGKGPPEPA